MKFRKKPVVIDAFRLPEAGPAYDLRDFNVWCREVGFIAWGARDDGTIEVSTLEGVMLASPGDWIVRGVKGEFYPCKPYIFDATYEPA